MEKVIEHVNYDYDDRNRGDGAEKWRWLLRYETHSHVEQNYYYGSRLNVVRRKVFLPKTLLRRLSERAFGPTNKTKYSINQDFCLE